MEVEKFKSVLKEVVRNLTKGDYAAVVANDVLKEVGIGVIREAIEDHPGSISMPPDSAFEYLDWNKFIRQWVTVDIDLWYNGIQSDLTLSCCFREKDGKIKYGLQGIQILYQFLL